MKPSSCELASRLPMRAKRRLSVTLTSSALTWPVLPDQPSVSTRLPRAQASPQRSSGPRLRFHARTAKYTCAVRPGQRQRAAAPRAWRRSGPHQAVGIGLRAGQEEGVVGQWLEGQLVAHPVAHGKEDGCCDAQLQAAGQYPPAWARCRGCRTGASHPEARVFRRSRLGLSGHAGAAPLPPTSALLAGGQAFPPVGLIPRSPAPGGHQALHGQAGRAGRQQGRDRRQAGADCKMQRHPCSQRGRWTQVTIRTCRSCQAGDRTAPDQGLSARRACTQKAGPARASNLPAASAQEDRVPDKPPVPPGRSHRQPAGRSSGRSRQQQAESPQPQASPEARRSVLPQGAADGLPAAGQALCPACQAREPAPAAAQEPPPGQHPRDLAACLTSGWCARAPALMGQPIHTDKPEEAKQSSAEAECAWLCFARRLRTPSQAAGSQTDAGVDMLFEGLCARPYPCLCSEPASWDAQSTVSAAAARLRLAGPDWARGLQCTSRGPPAPRRQMAVGGAAAGPAGRLSWSDALEQFPARREAGTSPHSVSQPSMPAPPPPPSRRSLAGG